MWALFMWHVSHTIVFVCSVPRRHLKCPYACIWSSCSLTITLPWCVQENLKPSSRVVVLYHGRYSNAGRGWLQWQYHIYRVKGLLFSLKKTSPNTITSHVTVRDHRHSTLMFMVRCASGVRTRTLKQAPWWIPSCACHCCKVSSSVRMCRVH